jgi:O-antigen ligase
VLAATGKLKRQMPAFPALGIALAVLLTLGHASLATHYPVIVLGVGVVAAFAFFPPLCRAVMLLVVATGPTVNPALLGFGPAGGGTVVGGRIYLVQAALVLVTIGAFAAAHQKGLQGQAVAVGGAVVALILLQTVGRPDAGLAWVYRPLQIFLLALAVRILFQGRDHRQLLLSLAWGSAIGCALASLHALAPTIDPFAVSRPENLPFVSAIGGFARATGAFTYPNNLGTFAAYAVLFGIASLFLGRPSLPRPLGWFVVFSGSSALLLSGSRAAGLGLLCGVLYLTAKLQPRRRALILAAEALIGMVVVLAVFSSPTAAEVAEQRIATAGSESLSLRLQGSRAALDAFLASPLIGTGANEARTDNFWLLYLSQGGLVGAALYLLLARKSLSDGRRPKAYPELWMALLIAIGTSGLLQDSLGQTLASWFPGILIGICALAPMVPSHAGELAERSPQTGSDSGPGRPLHDTLTR